MKSLSFSRFPFSGPPGTLAPGVPLIQDPLSFSTVVSLAHGLGSIPILVTATAICKIAESGYSPGDTLMLPGSNVAATGGYSIWADSVTLAFAIGPRIDGNNKTSGASFSLTAANWKIVVIPYRLNLG